jgi:hypothetical protein
MMFLLAVALGVLVGGVSSLVTRRFGVTSGVLVAIAFIIAAWTVLFLTDDVTAPLSAMLTFAVTAAIFDPSQKKYVH